MKNKLLFPLEFSNEQYTFNILAGVHEWYVVIGTQMKKNPKGCSFTDKS